LIKIVKTFHQDFMNSLEAWSDKSFFSSDGAALNSGRVSRHEGDPSTRGYAGSAMALFQLSGPIFTFGKNVLP
jgi:hypothetical protein